jgi:hypothetical protein
MIAAAVVLSKSFNNGFDFERGLWWRKMGAAAYAPKTRVFGMHPKVVTLLLKLMDVA